MNNTHLDQAREWARDNIDDFYEGERVYAVCEVIHSLPDHWIDAEKVAELADDMSNWCLPDGPSTTEIDYRHLVEIMDGFTGRINDLLTPLLPTLADMTPKEREACVGMWCEVPDTTTKDESCLGVVAWLIVNREESSATVTVPGQYQRSYVGEKITPRFDLPRAWNPDGTPPTAQTVPDQAVAKDVCNSEERALPRPEDVPAQEAPNEETPPAEMVNNPSSGHSADLPNPEDVPAGEVWMIRPHENADPVPAFRVHASKYGPGKRWAHYRVGGSMLGFADDEHVTLVSRLVPEDKP